MNPQEQTNYDQPVAYDKDGRPLYAHPPAETSTVKMADPQVNSDAAKRHDESAKRYPDIKLSDEEYVILEMRRHWIGLLAPLVAGGFLALVVLVGLVAYPEIFPAGGPPLSAVIFPALLVLVLIAVGVYIPVWVYRSNHFYLTNQRIIQELQASLFSRNEETVSLGDVEDVGFKQTGVMALLLDYGTIELSTPGDEDTYRYTYVCGPKDRIADVNSAVKEFKNNRKVSWS